MSSSKFLQYYSKIFDFVEVNSSFYAIPTNDTILNWKESTPANFQFSIKVWNKITHELFNEELEERIMNFFSHFNILKTKIPIYLVQFPPRFKYTEKNKNRLQFLLKILPMNNKYAIEFRDTSWYDEDVLKEIQSPKISICSSFHPKFDPFFDINQPIQYIRMIGDRSLTKFNQTQRLQKEFNEKLHQSIQAFQKNPNITDIFVIFNNHYQGFSPQDVNNFKKLLGIKTRTFQKNKSLSEFL